MTMSSIDKFEQDGWTKISISISRASRKVNWNTWTLMLFINLISLSTTLIDFNKFQIKVWFQQIWLKSMSDCQTNISWKYKSIIIINKTKFINGGQLWICLIGEEIVQLRIFMTETDWDWDWSIIIINKIIFQYCGQLWICLRRGDRSTLHLHDWDWLPR